MDVTVFYLEMHEPAQLRPCRRAVERIDLTRAEQDFELNRTWYESVGRDWTWTDRLVWSDDRWRAFVSQPGFETWIAMLNGAAAGYVELDEQQATGVEIASFGLLPEFLGRGLGGPFLTAAIKRAWEKKPSRVWLHTCTLDHPQALANYQARGFEVYKTETQSQTAD